MALLSLSMKETTRQRKQPGHGDHGHGDEHSPVTKHDLNEATKKILHEIMKYPELKPIIESVNATLVEIRTDNTRISTQLDKVAAEVQTLIDAGTANPDVPADVAASIARLGELVPGLKSDQAAVAAKVTAVDEKLPDAAAVTP